MKYHRLGKSELMVSEIAFGCMSLGVDEGSNKLLIDAALDVGINFFDTADLYQEGENERQVGKALKEVRDKVVIATKVGNQLREDGTGWDWNPRKSYILSAVEESLRRLNTDYIDLYQLHGGTLDDPIDETIEAFEQLKNQGKIRYYGISSIRPNVIRQYVEKSNIVSVMMQYSLLDLRPEESCLNLLSNHNIGVLARGALAKGLLVDKSPSGYLDHSEGAVRKAQEMVWEISDGKRKPVETALHYVLQHPAITSAVVGIRTQNQLDQIIQFDKSQQLTFEESESLKGAVKKSVYENHR